MLGPMSAQSLYSRALWPLLLLLVVAFVVVDFVRHPYLGSESQAAAPRAHLTLWLAETEAAGESQVVREAAGSLVLYGRPATIGLLPGGASQAVTSFLSRRQAPGQLLAVSNETLADLSQERSSALAGEEPLQAAHAQSLLEHAIPIGVLGGEPLVLAVSPDSPVRDVGDLFAQLRRSAQAHVFAITDDNWATDNLAALVQDAGVEGVVPYRVFPSPQDASLALAAGDADVVLAPYGALAPDFDAGQLRALHWPAAAGSPPRSWVELLAGPHVPRTEVLALRRQLRKLERNGVWRSLAGVDGRAPSEPLSGTSMRSFLTAQIERITELQQVALRVERH
jgi:hypothetical protein